MGQKGEGTHVNRKEKSCKQTENEYHRSSYILKHQETVSLNSQTVLGKGEERYVEFFYCGKVQPWSLSRAVRVTRELKTSWYQVILLYFAKKSMSAFFLTLL